MAQPALPSTASSNTAVSNTPLATAPNSSSMPFLQQQAGQPVTAFANIAVGTFTLNGTTAVTITDAGVNITSFIGISLNTVGGTVGVFPHIATITAATGFTVVGTASDTSVYNYIRIG